MDNTRQIREYLAALEHMKKFFNKLLEEEKAILSGPASEREQIAELTELRMLAQSDLWPLAVPKNLISEENAESQMARATGILHELVGNLSGKKFLDFGCGAGYVTDVAQNIFGATSIGYDIKENISWSHRECRLTDKISTVKELALYDIILLYDVLDHVDNPVEILKLCKELKATDGRIHVRFHPWASRTGTNLHKSLNKAYLHLVFNDKELASLGVISEKTTKLDSIAVYKEWIKEAGLMINSESSIKQEVELFFTHNPAILRRIKSNFGVFPRDLLEVQFVDYVLV